MSASDAPERLDDGELAELLEGFRARAAEVVRCASCRAELPDDAHPGDRCEPCATKLRQRRRLDAWAKAVPATVCEVHLGAPWLVGLVGREVVRDLEANEIPGVVTLLGPAGAGKTSLAAALSRRAVLGGKASAVTWTLADALARVPSSSRLGQGDPLDPFVRAPLLVVDELGGEAPNLEHVVRGVLVARHQGGARTIVTSGLTLDELRARYDAGVMRRLVEGAAVVQLRGPRRSP